MSTLALPPSASDSLSAPDSSASSTASVIESLKKLYSRSILPIEKKYLYKTFFTSAMTNSEFESKPQVLLVGQYSVGKTSFIRYLLGRDFPGQRIGE